MRKPNGITGSGDLSSGYYRCPCLAGAEHDRKCVAEALMGAFRIMERTHSQYGSEQWDEARYYAIGLLLGGKLRIPLGLTFEELVAHLLRLLRMVVWCRAIDQHRRVKRRPRIVSLDFFGGAAA